MNNNMNINFMNPDDDRDLDLSLGLQPPSVRRQPAPAPSPTPLISQPHPVPPLMESLYYPNPMIEELPPNHPLHYVALGSPAATNMNMNMNALNEPPLDRVRPRRNPRNNGDDAKRIIEPPYRWATGRPAFIHDKAHLEENSIYSVTGTVRCNKCDKGYDVEFNIREKVDQFVSFVASKKGTMHDRAVPEWTSPPSLVCKFCREDGVKPVISEKKDNINWLFLFLGQMLGFCTLEQLKYFCACTQNHRTGAKDRVLYLTYREIFRQLYPQGSQDAW